ncbi:transcription-repair coupling factor [Nitratidesulfovibrio sp.]|uniref:transcription-repair coupling factor n=1 Tax=Nitratidesulfovibrio sp. TaxID=2802297 RepID=UPI003342A835
MNFEQLTSRLAASGLAIPTIGGSHSGGVHALAEALRIEVARSGMGGAARLALALMRAGRDVVMLVRDAAELAEARALTTLFSPELSGADPAVTQARWDAQWIVFPQHPAGTRGRGAWAARMASLYALSRREHPRGIIISVDNLLPKLPPVDIFEHHELRLARGEDMSPELVLDQAIDWGFERAQMVSRPGEASRRGDILDIFPPGYEKPLRLEFFGDTLEDIRLFDATTQRSLASLDEFRLLPVAPVVGSREYREAAARRWKQLRKDGVIDGEQAAALSRMAEGEVTGLLPGAWYENATWMEDWLPRDAVWLLPDRADLSTALEAARTNWEALLDRQYDEHRLRQPRTLVLRDADEAESAWRGRSVAHFERLVMGVERTGVDLPERRLHAFRDLFAATPAVPVDEDRPWQRLVTALRQWTSERRQVVLSFASDRSRRKFLKLAEQDGVRPALRYSPTDRGLYALVAPFRAGIDLAWDNVLVIGEDVLQPKADRQPRVPTGAFLGLDRYDDLSPGDLLVHRDYGVGRFGGLHRMDLGGVANDFLLLEYAGEDRLYLPVDRLSLIQRFKGSGDDAAPSLDKLGGSGWRASKDKARKAIEKIAADLVEMYAYRKVAKGYRYGPLGELYREFEASFGFEETPDQARAIQDVLDDMEKPEPMDRLVCGDVGFGKTEVALRAAFRAAAEGRQVALLCPTTVLAEQHYQTFRSRLAGFPVNVGMLSRFVSRQKQKEVLQSAARGQIDILIGTHRLLSDDVQLPNLGLLVLDEEQRFGVRHKEKLKKFRKNVDALTLTATPIPRTLQLSMSGIRELSVIETAPPERKPVATALIERDQNALRQILEREIAREGQVFWVHNRVQGLERVAEFVRGLVPAARVGMAHGQMGERELEDTMHKFWHGELDVLVCTAIVESGLDFPRANTLIVDQAQMFGLGQLYQLRGRVGRSDRQAYAVFVVSDADRLPELARQRMRIILELDYLGAGFQVAMEDLRLRGAGNILGEVQSGHMTRLGLDLYLEMLEEEVARLKGDPPRDSVEPELNIGLAAHIPETYIGDARERLKFYKALSSAPDAATLQDVEMELRDRFGPCPPELRNFLAVLVLKRFLATLQVVRADIHPERLRLVWDERQTVIAPERLVAWVGARQGRARLLPPATLEVRMAPVPGSAAEAEGDLGARLDTIRTELAGLAAMPAVVPGPVYDPASDTQQA